LGIGRRSPRTPSWEELWPGGNRSVSQFLKLSWSLLLKGKIDTEANGDLSPGVHDGIGNLPRHTSGDQLQPKTVQCEFDIISWRIVGKHHVEIAAHSIPAWLKLNLLHYSGTRVFGRNSPWFHLPHISDAVFVTESIEPFNSTRRYYAVGR